jgi:diadenosine tetraphosphatase ApaH/serine/threonine PP2A family protein phosphatase
MLALKVAFPARVFLVRGNHEFRDLNTTGANTFWAACTHLYDADPSEYNLQRPSVGRTVFDAFHGAFDYLPLGAVIAGSVLVVHGGLGDGTWTLADLAAIARPVTESGNAAGTRNSNIIQTVLWSDPNARDEAPNVFAEMKLGVHGSPRGTGIKTFGKDVTRQWCARNGIQLVIRSHQFVPEGYRIMHDGKLVTVFSARNYTGVNLTNDGALLLLADDENGQLVVRPKKLQHIA